MKVRLLCWFVMLLLSHPLLAQKMQKVKAEYVYYAPENVSLEEAKRTALERAKIQAIADTYGTIVSQSNTTLITNKNGKTDTDFLSLGGSEVKGEWIETIGEPKYDIAYQQETLVVKVIVAGRVREIVSAPVDFDARVLCNGTDLKFERQDFREGDELYLYFKSPIDGYLSVYLLDKTQGVAYCLLPYRSQKDGAFKIKANLPYILFSEENKTSKDIQIDEYTMTSNSRIEHNQLYIIFSPHSFVKAIDENLDYTLPRILNHEKFHKWLAKIRKHDKNMRLKIETISIMRIN